jgi:tRNA-dihydrouridine synthase A
MKCRIGVDEQDLCPLQHFIQVVASAGCKTFILHARSVACGLSPNKIEKFRRFVMTW